jgi:chloramphenicol-sensitive protein RarD
MSGTSGAGTGTVNHAASVRVGAVQAVAAYILWGGLPLYFVALAPANAFEIVAWRVLFSLAFCAILVSATRGWRRLAGIITTRRVVLTLGVAGILVFINWQTYILATVNGNVVEAALGYFINPIVTVLLGVVFLGERLRIMQWCAVAVSLVAVGVLAFGYGQVPWIALVLAFSFGLYGLVKKRVGRDVDALSGLTLETMWLTPVAIVELIIVQSVSGVTFASDGPGHALLLAGAGIVTAIPLLLFAGAARRLPLVLIGFIQYLTPVFQLVVGVAFLHESMPPSRWIGFAIVWLALAMLSIDMVRAWRRSRGGRPSPGHTGIIEQSAG